MQDARTYRVELILAVVLAALFTALCLHLAAGPRLTHAEVEAFVAKVERGLVMPEPDRTEFVSRLRAWGQADDGEPFYLMNLIRLNERLRPWPGVTVDAATPAQANRVYLDYAVSVVLRSGTYPAIGTDMHGIATAAGRRSNLVGYDAEFDGWSEVNLNRYASRRAFFELVSDPRYLRVMPYKFAAMKLVTTPVSARIVLPDPRLLAGATFLIVFLGVGWWRTARRRVSR